MKTNDFLTIKYGAFIYNEGVKELDEVVVFKEEINNHYNNIVKPIPVGRGGGAYEFLIHFISNLHLSDYVYNILIVYFGQKVIDKVFDKSIDKILDKYLFTSLQNAYNDLKNKKLFLDCHSFEIEFQDVTIVIYKIYDNSLFLNLTRILEEINNHFESIKNIENHKVTEIHIPALLDIVDNGEKLYRVPLGIKETITNLTDKDYFNFLGVKYRSNQLSSVYNLNISSFQNNYMFYTEQEFSFILKNENS